MNLPFEYDHVAVGEFGGTTPTQTDFERARVVMLPVPLDRTTSYVPGTRYGPARDPRGVVAHGVVGRRDRDRRPQHRHLHAAGDGVPVRHDGRGHRRDPPRGLGDRRREASSRSCSAASTRLRRADRRRRGRAARGICRCCRSTPTPTCATPSWERRTITRARCGACSTYAPNDPGRHPQSVAGGSRGDPVARDDDLLRPQHAPGPAVDRSRRRVAERHRLHHDRLATAWIRRSCRRWGRPSRAGLSWYETLAVLRRVIEAKNVVGCDLVELCPIPGMAAPNFLCAKLVYKILSYRFGAEVRRR